MKLMYIKQIIKFLILSFILSYILITTKDLLTRIIIIIFLIFTISLLIKNVCLMLDKNKLVKTFGKINVLVFSMYYFGFLIYWDYVSIMNKDYMSLLFSLLPWGGGGYIIYKKFKKYSN